MTMRIFICLLLGCLASGCAGEDGGGSNFSAVARDRAELFEYVDGEVAVIGTAQSSADRGAVVALEDGTLVGVAAAAGLWLAFGRGAFLVVAAIYLVAAACFAPIRESAAPRGAKNWLSALESR